MTRQLAGFALAASMLHLNVERADLACASHSGRHTSVVTPHHAQVGGEHHTTHGRDAHGVTESERCQTPAQPDCCLALASCSLVLGVDDSPTRAAAREVHSAILAAIQPTPLSRVTAPDPPPPKR